MRLTTVPDQEAVAHRGAELVVRALAGRAPAHLALAGGSTPRRCHELLASMIPDWSPVHVWLSDERAVGPDDEDSNFRMVRESLLDRIEIPGVNVHRVLGELGADAAAERYEAEVREWVPAGPNGVPRFDVIMCGLGPDGHTCSLFPGHPEVDITDRLVVGVHHAPKPPPDRITFTLPLLHAARHTILLAAGAEKADAVAKVFAGPDHAVPASLLRFGHLDVVVDDAAAPPPSRTGDDG